MCKVEAAARRALLEHRRLPIADRGSVRKFLLLCEGYAALERKILNNLLFDMPVHRILIRGGAAAALRNEARSLAEAARGLLELDFPVLGLTHALEKHGARIFQMPLSSSVMGLFVFVGAIAPCFLLNSRLQPGALGFALAHLYCHFLVDNDPYVPQVCVMDSTGSEESEVRADSFAEELLMPETGIAPFVDSGPSVEALASYLDMPPSIVGARMQGLGYDLPDFDPADRWGPSRGVVYPERLVRLALEGMQEGKLVISEFASELRLTIPRAVELLRLSSTS